MSICGQVTDLGMLGLEIGFGGGGCWVVRPHVVCDFFSVLFSIEVSSLTFLPLLSVEEGSGTGIGFSTVLWGAFKFFTISAILDLLGVALMSGFSVLAPAAGEWNVSFCIASRSGGGGGKSSMGSGRGLIGGGWGWYA